MLFQNYSYVLLVKTLKDNILFIKLQMSYIVICHDQNTFICHQSLPSSPSLLHSLYCVEIFEICSIYRIHDYAEYI